MNATKTIATVDDCYALLCKISRRQRQAEHEELKTKTVLTIEECCQFLNLKKKELTRLINSNRIPYSNPEPKVYYFVRVKIEEWMLSCPNSAPDEE